MKKFILIGLIIFSGASNLFAQFSMGPKLGVNISTLSEEGSEYKAGVNVGIMANYRFNKYLAIQPEFLYSLQGCGVDAGYDVTAKYDLHYINIPVLLKIYPFTDFNIHLGPQFSFLIDDKISVQSDGTKVSGDGFEGMNTFDLALAMGIGYDFKFGLTIDARFNLGLTKLMADFDDKNRAFMISLGYKFNL